jgi:hypothetical protein
VSVYAPERSRFLSRIADGLDPQPDPMAAQGPAWVRTRLHEHVVSYQETIMDSVRDNGRTAVKSAHAIGKSHIASRAVGWWLDTHPIDDVFVVTTAPSTNQVKAILWRYIKVVRQKGRMPGYITEGDTPEWKWDGTLVAYGRKPQDLRNQEEAATAFQGIHAKYVLVLLDEAGGVPKWLWTAIDTLLTSPTNRVLAIGNPDDPSSEFERVCRPGSGWNVITISAFETPAFTGESCPQEVLDRLVSPEWVEYVRGAWGEGSPLYISKVLAEFPEVSEETLLYPSWVRAAQDRDLSPNAIKEPGVFGLDVARSGTNETVCYRNRAGMIRLEWRALKQDTMVTSGRMAQVFNATLGYAPAHVDTVGIGGGVYDRLREQGFPVIAFVASERPTTAHAQVRFVNRRAEQWWTFREGLEQGFYDLPPDGEDDLLISQLLSIKYRIRSDGRIIIESKDDMEKRGLPSPDRADAVMQSTCGGGSQFWLPPARRVDGRGVDEGSITADLLEKKW